MWPLTVPRNTAKSLPESYGHWSPNGFLSHWRAHGIVPQFLRMILTFRMYLHQGVSWTCQIFVVVSPKCRGVEITYWGLFDQPVHTNRVKWWLAIPRLPPFNYSWKLKFRIPAHSQNAEAEGMSPIVRLIRIYRGNAFWRAFWDFPCPCQKHKVCTLTSWCMIKPQLQVWIIWPCASLALAVSEIQGKTNHRLSQISVTCLGPHKRIFAHHQWMLDVWAKYNMGCLCYWYHIDPNGLKSYHQPERRLDVWNLPIYLEVPIGQEKLVQKR